MENIECIEDCCVGCGACKNICPKSAIVMQKNSEGFVYPVIDDSKCIGCGLCLHSCPLSNNAFRPDTKLPKCYAVQSTSDIMKHSSSGGMFSVLANYVLENGGYVCGASFDRSWSVEHKIISDKSKLYDLQTSKYVQSNTKSVYKEIKELLVAGSLVLFSGTPCQVAGLYSFLGKDYDNLITVDVFCHGVPSPEVWRRYLKEIAPDNISDINFRHKSTPPHAGWKQYEFSIKSRTSMIKEHVSKNVYMLGFLRNLYLRKSCHHCLFAKTPRTSDFSLGDFWGYEAIDKKTNTQQGMSAVLVNTSKAEKIFSFVKTKLSFVRKVDLTDIISGNDVLCQSVPENPNRAAFFEDFKTNTPVIPMIQKYLVSKDVAILNFSSFSKPNFGAGLVGYAMEKAIKKLGYTPHTINFIPENEFYQYTKQNSFSSFQNTFLHLTGICRNKSELHTFINQGFDKFIIGSDQIVRHPWHYDFIYYLDWVDGNKTLLSYAASFGRSDLGMNRKEKKYAKKCLDRFDAFSVREHSGFEIMKNKFNKNNVPIVCDPTLLLNPEDYQEIIDTEASNQELPNGEYIAYYLLDENPNVLADLMKKYQIINAYKDNQGKYRTFGEWLNIIKNAKYVITDSFHGSVFSIIYKRQFIVLTTKSRGNERLESLMQIIGENRLIADSADLTEQRLFSKQIDYSEVLRGISKAQNNGFEYLRQALQISPNKKEKIIRGINVFYFSLFGIPLIKITKKKNNKIKISFIGIPFLKIYNGKIYLFNFLKIGCYSQS